MSPRRIGKIGRRPPVREPKKLFILFCEGKNTEPAYFEEIKKVLTGSLIDLQTIPAVGVPMTIAKKAVEFSKERGLIKNRRRRRYSYEEHDEVWAVFDRDNHQKYRESINHCESNNVKVARSDPCFELWLILHEEDYDRPDGRNYVQKKFECMNPSYDVKKGKTPEYQEMMSRVEEAERRAKELLRRRCEEGNPYGCPSTTVGLLTKEIREADRKARNERL